MLSCAVLIFAAGAAISVAHTNASECTRRRGGMECYKHFYVIEKTTVCSAAGRRKRSLIWWQEPPKPTPSCTTVHVRVQKNVTLHTMTMDPTLGIFQSPNFPEVKEEKVTCRIKLCGSSENRYRVDLTHQYMNPEEMSVSNCVNVKGRGRMCNGRNLLPVETETNKLVMEFIVERKTDHEGEGGVRGVYVELGPNGEIVGSADAGDRMSRRSGRDAIGRESSIVNKTELGALKSQLEQVIEELKTIENPLGESPQTGGGMTVSDDESDFRMDDLSDFVPDQCDLPSPPPAHYRTTEIGIYCHTRYFFDKSSGQCERIYLSKRGAQICDLNQRNCFPNSQSCDKICLYVCSLPKSQGYGDTLKVRYYYNAELNECTTFLYAGNGGSGNNFETVEQCEHRCKQSMVDKLMMSELKDVAMHPEKMKEYEQNPNTKWMMEKLHHDGFHSKNN